MSTETSIETTVKLKEPKLYKVVLLNDNYTPINFVMEVLIEIFGKSTLEAEQLTMQIHNEGRGLCGTFTKDIADQKVYEVSTVAKHYGHPLKAVSEPA